MAYRARIAMIIRYLLSVPISIAADVLAFLLAPLAAMFAYKEANGREQLYRVWAWIYTHDAPIDSGHVDGYWAAPSTRFGRYWSRVKWIWRNPAYRVDHWLGYDQRGMAITRHRDEWSLRDSGVNNTTHYTAINSRNARAFMYFRQVHYTPHRALELYFGWKLLRKDIDKRCMLSFRVKPFKKIQ